MLATIADHANTQATWRCPYKDRHDRCTAAFGCRNQRRPAAGDPRFEPGAGKPRFLCAGDDKLDYRSAWEVDAVAATSQEGPDGRTPERQRRRAGGEVDALAATGDGPAAADHGSGTIACGAERLRPVAGDTLFDYADQAATRVPSSCARTGICHECVVRVDAGIAALSPRTEVERFLQDPFRLACQTEVTDLSAEVAFQPLRRSPRILTDGARAGRERTLDAELLTGSGAGGGAARGTASAAASSASPSTWAPPPW